MQFKAGDKVYWNGKKWEIFLMWNDTSSKVPVCCLLNTITGETVDAFVSSLKPILRAKNDPMPPMQQTKRAKPVQ